MRRWGLAGVFALLAALLATSLTPRVQAGECAGSISYTEGYLTNGGFEGEYYGDGNDLIGGGWTRINRAGTPNWTSTGLFNQVWNGGAEPEKIECDDSALITGGTGEAWKQGHPYDTILYQRVTGLTPGQTYSFAGWVLKAWGGTHPNARNLPRDPYSLGSWIGVDPTGGTNPNAASVVWGEPDWDDEVDPKWANHRMAVVPRGDMLTVFVRVQHKWEKDHTVVFVDAMELFEAPRATLHTQSGDITESDVTLNWSGELLPSLQARGAFAMHYAVQRQQPDGSWATLADELRDTSYTVTVPEGESATFRVLPYAKQPPGSAGQWPPTTHTGLPTEAITLSYGDPTRLLPFDLFLPQVVRD